MIINNQVEKSYHGFHQNCVKAERFCKVFFREYKSIPCEQKTTTIKLLNLRLVKFKRGAKFPIGRGHISWDTWPTKAIFPSKYGPGDQIFWGGILPVTSQPMTGRSSGRLDLAISPSTSKLDGVTKTGWVCTGL